jgi:hypothetical protein
MMLPSRLLSSLSAIVITLCGSVLAQAVPGITQDAKNSSCSNIVALVGSVSLDCSSLTPAQKKIIDSIPSLLHKIIAQQLDPKLVMEKLDEIIANQEKQAEAIRKIQTQQGRWVLGTATEHRMFDILKNTPGISVVIDEWADSTRSFSDGLIDLFIRLNVVDQKWQVSQRGGMSASAPPIGIGCEGPDGLAVPMKNIEAALQLISPDIHCLVVPGSRLGPHDQDSVRIWVGDRP